MTTRQRYLLLERDCLASDAIRQLAPDDPTAVVEGRVFVGRQRLEDAATPLQQGQWITCYSARQMRDGAPSVEPLLLERRDGFVAVAKPAAWASEPDRAGSTHSLREHLAQLLGERELHIATRLDVGVSGLVLAATDTASRRHLAEVFDAGHCHRHYVAMTTGQVSDRGQWVGSVERPTQHQPPRHAVTQFERVGLAALGNGVQVGRSKASETASLLVLKPQTGHRHQLRIHSSRAGVPIIGDRRFGGATRFTGPSGAVISVERICLHAFATTIPMPNGTAWQLQCAVPEELCELWLRLGGKPADLASLP